MRHAVVARERSHYPVRVLCRVQDVSVSNFHDHLRRQAKRSHGWIPMQRSGPTCARSTLAVGAPTHLRTPADGEGFSGPAPIPSSEASGPADARRRPASALGLEKRGLVMSMNMKKAKRNPQLLLNAGLLFLGAISLKMALTSLAGPF